MQCDLIIILNINNFLFNLNYFANFTNLVLLLLLLLFTNSNIFYYKIILATMIVV